jgi:hypothetical protein
MFSSLDVAKSSFAPDEFSQLKGNRSVERGEGPTRAIERI